MRFIKKILWFILIFPFLFLYSCNETSETEFTSEIFVMNTFVSQKVYGSNAKKAIKQVNECLITLEKELSLYEENSDIYNINKNAGISPVKVNTYTLELLKAAVEYSEKSQGLFDITIAPLTILWGINSDNPKVPQSEEILQAVSLVNYRDLEIDFENQTAFLKKSGMSIDLGGIAKGYIVNEIQKIYNENGIASALISIGGNIYTYHKKIDGNDYTLGIRDPNGMANDYIGKLKCHDAVVATTGAYERFFEQGGIKYHHILSTQTGYPVDSDLLSVTVVSKDGGLADFLSTTLFISGSQQIEKYLNCNDFSVIVIDKNNQIYISEKLKNNFEITNSDYKLI